MLNVAWVIKSRRRGRHNRYPYRDEMLLAYEKLATLIEQIVDPQPNVVTMVRS